jgi:putative colanic acid biosynthesis glycosyltransferase
MLSVVTINFNNASGLTKTLSSLAPFRKSGFEWVFIDGGSKDQSVELSKKFSLPTDIVVSEPDSGIYNAMNKGIQYATGDQILFLNSGDVLHPEIQSIEELGLDKTADLHLFGFEIRNRVRMPRMNTWRIWSMPTSHQAIIYSSRLLRKLPFD